MRIAILIGFILLILGMIGNFDYADELNTEAMKKETFALAEIRNHEMNMRLMRERWITAKGQR